MTLAYKQERKAFESIVELFPKNRVPRTYYFYRQKSTNIIIIDYVTLVSIKNDKGEITGFKSPSWDTNKTQKYKDGNTLFCKI